MTPPPVETTGRRGQEHFNRDHSPVRTNIKAATMTKGNGNIEATEQARQQAKEAKLMAARQQNHDNLVEVSDEDDTSPTAPDPPAAQTASA